MGAQRRFARGQVSSESVALLLRFPYGGSNYGLCRAAKPSAQQGCGRADGGAEIWNHGQGSSQGAAAKAAHSLFCYLLSSDRLMSHQSEHGQLEHVQSGTCTVWNMYRKTSLSCSRLALL